MTASADNLDDLVLTSDNPFDNKDEVPFTEELCFDPATGKDKLRKHYAAIDVVGFWLEKSGATFSYKTGSLTCSLGELPFNRILRLIILHADKKKIPVGQVKAELALQEWIDQKRDKVLQKYKTDLFVEGCTKEKAIDKARELVKAWTGKERDLDIYALLHFIWQVKRKLNGKKADDHLMPVLVGKQGGGKSEAVRKFLNPIYDLYSDLNDLRVLADERQLGLLSSNFVLFADEMGKGEKVPVDLLKNAISGTLVKQRVMRSTEHATLIHRCTFIGAANEQLNDIIHDSTGMRRYWQISCLDRLDWETINKFDIQALWQSVDHNWTSIYADHRAAFYSAQDTELRSKTSIEQFFDEGEDYIIPDPANPNEGDWITSANLYASYTAFCARSKTTAFSRVKFAPKVRALGVEFKRTKGGSYFRLLLSKSSSNITN